MAEPKTIQTKTIPGSTSSSQWTWKMEVIENSYNIEENTSSVTVKSYLGRANSQSYFGGSASINITCNEEPRDESKSFSYPTYVNGGGWILIQEEEFTIEHDDDGKKDINVSSSLSTGDFDPNSASANGDMTLTTIPRASSVSVSNYDLGQNINIVIGKKVSSFTSTLTFKIGKKYGNIVEKTNDSNYIWVMSDSLIKEIKASNPNTKNISATIYCDTYNGDTKIGSTQNATFTLTIIDLPTIESITIEEQNTMVSGLTTDIVKYVSKPKITVSATAPYGTTIKKYYFLKGDTTYNSDTNEYILENIQDSFMDEDILKTRFTVYVEDNRGNVSLETIEDRKFIDYVNLAINTTDIKLARLTNVSNTVKLSLTGFVYNGLIGESQNTVSVKYRYKLQSSDEWSSFTTIPTTLEDNTFKITDLELAGEFDYRENYNFEFYATDLLQTTPASTFLLSSTEYVYLFHKNGADFKTLTEGKKRVALKEDVDLSYAKIKTDFNEKSFTSEAQVTGFINDINYGDYKSDAINNRIIIKNTEFVEINGFIGGNGSSWSGIMLKESETGDTIDDTNSRRPLYQFSGNGYWSAPLPTLIYKLDKNKTYYLYLYSAGYNGTFNLNAGMGSQNTWISATKIK